MPVIAIRRVEPRRVHHADRVDHELRPEAFRRPLADLLPRGVGGVRPEIEGLRDARTGVSEGKLVVGTWQQVFLIELDIKPRTREMIVTVYGG